ncbi:hypothetical protein [Halorientalis salina]|uniref:hypothetical protein n=1 Tax=Halorientalis salina TaxID=2932266 RepID=UPI0010ACBF92|nr:hypothetical protein [Halorientalis salina]
MTGHSDVETRDCWDCDATVGSDDAYCPECGADQNREPDGFLGNGRSFYAVVAGEALFVAMFLLLSLPGSVAGAVALLSFVVIPVAVHFDLRYVRLRTSWRPNAAGWRLVVAVPFLNGFAVPAYLCCRWLGGRKSALVSGRIRRVLVVSVVTVLFFSALFTAVWIVECFTVGCSSTAPT